MPNFLARPTRPRRRKLRGPFLLGRKRRKGRTVWLGAELADPSTLPAIGKPAAQVATQQLRQGCELGGGTESAFSNLKVQFECLLEKRKYNK
jgi:hypothetical protein